MKKKRIVVKIGTNVISQKNGLLDFQVMADLCEQITKLKSEGIEVIMVSSGSIGAGRSLIKPSKTNEVIKNQVLAAVGQVELMRKYSEIFQKHKLTCAQILTTKEDFRDRLHYLNMKNCFEGLLKDEIIPIVNENDTIAVSELMFTDNDELAGLIASMMNADALIICTCVDGIFDRDPNDPKAQVIHEISPSNSSFAKGISPNTSSFGRGGMMTKAKMAQKLASVGITTHIINGHPPRNIVKIMSGAKIGTTFIAGKKLNPVKKWIAYSSENEKGRVYINNCAVEIIKSKKKVISLLPIGITKVEGNFAKGDVIKIFSESGEELGLGIAQYDNKKAQENIGQKRKKALIHYDYLILH